MSKSYSGARAKKDINQKQIEKALIAIGASILDTSRLKNCFDLLVGFRGVTYIMEIKNPEYMTKAKRYAPQLSLTAGEYKFMDKWRGGTYHIVTTSKQALEIIGAIES